MSYYSSDSDNYIQDDYKELNFNVDDEVSDDFITSSDDETESDTDYESEDDIIYGNPYRYPKSKPSKQIINKIKKLNNTKYYYEKPKEKISLKWFIIPLSIGGYYFYKSKLYQQLKNDLKNKKHYI